ncbi:hypothetical protein BX070DRAFT_93387 [Coemansia spiralis]|nr:hypothetical protein BX070DRAFT_93387 [Coemansia spiralis]
MSDPLPQQSQPQSLGRIVGSLFGSRRIVPAPREHQQQQTLLPPQEFDSVDSIDSVPELLKPSVQRYSAKWTATKQRHYMSIQNAKLIDAQLGRLCESLYLHAETGRILATELSLIQQTKQNLAALQTQAEELKPVFAALEHLYASLADTDTTQLDDLVQQESRYRQSRHQHYLELQQAMDSQYEELQRNSMSARVANAERSFQRDLELYRQQQQQQNQQPDHLAFSLTQQGNRSKSNRGIADVVLSATDWGASGHHEDDFFSDEDDGAKSQQHQQPRQRQSLNHDSAAIVAKVSSVCQVCLWPKGRKILSGYFKASAKEKNQMAWQRCGSLLIEERGADSYNNDVEAAKKPVGAGAGDNSSIKRSESSTGNNDVFCSAKPKATVSISWSSPRPLPRPQQQSSSAQQQPQQTFSETSQLSRKAIEPKNTNASEEGDSDDDDLAAAEAVVVVLQDEDYLA